MSRNVITWCCVSGLYDLTVKTAAKISGCTQAARLKMTASRRSRRPAAATRGTAHATLVCSLVTSICSILSSPSAVPEVGRSTSSDLSKASAASGMERSTLFRAVSSIERLTHVRNVRITASVSMIVTGSANSMLIRTTANPSDSMSILLSWLTVLVHQEGVVSPTFMLFHFLRNVSRCLYPD